MHEVFLELMLHKKDLCLSGRLLKHKEHLNAKRNKQRKIVIICFHVSGRKSNTWHGATTCFKCELWLTACVHEYLCQQRLFFSFLLLQTSNHILASSYWQLVEMHIVIKQFPVCKYPVYTFWLQSLSLDRLLEYEESGYTVKNERNIKQKNNWIYCI